MPQNVASSSTFQSSQIEIVLSDVIQRPRTAQRRSDGDIHERLLAEGENRGDDVARDFRRVDQMQRRHAAEEVRHMLATRFRKEHVVFVDAELRRSVSPREEVRLNDVTGLGSR